MNTHYRPTISTYEGDEENTLETPVGKHHQWNQDGIYTSLTNTFLLPGLPIRYSSSKNS
ncbi:MAG TPA: hypothetical protein VER36_04740 [Flavisolibacter sp.]|nr:hypothetical protein [Flavisolibacter sp.]